MDNNFAQSELSEQEENIFQAALLVFAREGKEGATIQDIADKAGINKALVHYYFRSKEKLYDAVFGFVLERYFLTLAEALKAQPDFSSTLKYFIARYIDTFMRFPQLPRFMFGEILRDSEAVAARFQKRVERWPTNPFLAFRESLEKAVASGEIRKVDPVHTFLSVIGASVVILMIHPIARGIIPEVRDNLDRIIEERKQQVYDLIYNGLRP